MKNRNTYHLRDGFVNKKYSGGEGSCFAIPHSNLEIKGSPQTQLDYRWRRSRRSSTPVRSWSTPVPAEPGYRQPLHLPTRKISACRSEVEKVPATHETKGGAEPWVSSTGHHHRKFCDASEVACVAVDTGRRRLQGVMDPNNDADRQDPVKV